MERQRARDAVVLLSCCLLCCAATYDRELRLREDGTFKIVQFADVHFGEGEVQACWSGPRAMVTPFSTFLIAGRLVGTRARYQLDEGDARRVAVTSLSFFFALFVFVLSHIRRSAEKPDLVVYTGDQITGNNIHSNATLYWRQLVQPCIEVVLKGMCTSIRFVFTPPIRLAYDGLSCLGIMTTLRMEPVHALDDLP